MESIRRTLHVHRIVITPNKRYCPPHIADLWQTGRQSVLGVLVPYVRKDNRYSFQKHFPKKLQICPLGTLRAYVKKRSDPWPLKPGDAIFSQSGNKGNVWLRQITDLGPIPEDFQVRVVKNNFFSYWMECWLQIILEGVRGKGYVSDMAVDDVRLIPNCNVDDYMETST